MITFIEKNPGLVILLMLASMFSFVVWYNTSPAVVEARAKKAAQEESYRTPYVISRVDGCEVYTFKATDRFHYFTRCSDKVTTESSYSVRSGKQTHTETETITTNK